MTLPSARRPKWLQDEITAERLAAAAAAKKEKEAKVKMVIRTNSYDIFKMAMIEWYSTGLSDKEKKRLTPKGLKMKAVNTCVANNLEYDRLPLDWINDLQKECDLKVYVKVKQPEENLGPHPMSFGSTCEFKPKTRRELAMERYRELLKGSEEAPPASQGAAVDAAAAEPEPPKRQDDGVKKKKFVDFTSELPPGEWWGSYAKNEMTHRVQSIYSSEDTNYLYWDYNPKLKHDSGKDVKIPRQPRGDDLANMTKWIPSLAEPYVPDKSKRFIQEFHPMDD